LTALDERILKTDYVNLIERRSMGGLHISQVPKDAVRVASINEYKTWATADTTLVRTVANRAVVPGLHPVQQLVDGTWDYERNLHAVAFMGERVWLTKDQTVADIRLDVLPASMAAKVAEAAGAVGQIANAKKKALFACFARSGDMLVPREEAPKDAAHKYVASWVFEYRDIPLKLVEAWLAEEFTEVGNAPSDRMAVLHKVARLVFKAVDDIWAAKTVQPKVAEKAAETAE
jgi:hypothetical protein